jgi:O-antigen ligase
MLIRLTKSPGRDSVDRADLVRYIDSGFFKWSRLLLLGVLFCAPLAFGSVEPWGWGTTAVVVAVVLLFWAAGTVRSRRLVLACSWLYLPAIVLFGFVLLQLYGHLSLDAASTSEAILKLGLCLIVFFLTMQLYYVASERAWDRLGLSVLLYASLLGLFAILQFFSAPGLIYWVAPVANVNFGPYVNRDHFAGLYEMLIPIAGTYYISAGRKSPFSLLYAFALLIAVASLLFAGSRGGLSALVCELLILIVMMLVSAPERRRIGLVWSAGGLVLAAVVFLLLLAPSELPVRLASIVRFRDASVTGDRPQVTHDTLRIFRDHLTTGTGLGTFEAVYPQYQSLVTVKTWSYAHDDYAQFLAETGLPGGLLALLGLLIFLRETFWGRLRSGLSGTPAWIQFGAFLGCCGLLVHSFVDFNLHIPANAAWFAACTGLAVLAGPRRSACDPVKT